MTRALAVLWVAGCAGEATTATEETGTPATGPTWYGEVEPLVQANCVTCHQDGGIGTMRLDDYPTAKEWAPAMADSVQARRMPPWLESEDGSCRSFRNSRWLDDDAIATLTDWAAAGAPQGDPADAVTAPLPDPPALDRVDATVSTPNFVPQIVGSSYAETDEYRCFLVDNPNDADVWLTGYEVMPGNAKIVHHVLMMPMAPDGTGYNGQSNAQNVAEIDGADGRDGWPCFGAAGDLVSVKGIPVVWAPGMGAVEYPDLGVFLAASDQLVVQVHYNLADPANLGSSDQTRIALRTEAQVDRAGYLALPDDFLGSLFYGNPEVIPPGEASYTYSFDLTAMETLQTAGTPMPTWMRGFDLVGVMPHMHQLGHQQRVELVHPDGSTECLSDVQDWNFNWQLVYFYNQAVHVDHEDTLRVTCDWDSTARTEPTLPGWGTGNEMCLATLMVVPDP